MSLKSIRKRAGLTQERLAEKVGITQSAVAAHEAGTSGMSLATARKYAEALGITVDDLIREEPEARAS